MASAEPEHVFVRLDGPAATEAGDAEDDGSEFVVNVERPSSRSTLGLGLSPRGEELRVVKVKNGLIHKWNEENEAHAIRRGDSIVGVNGLTGSASELLSNIRVAHGCVELQVHRSARMDAEEPAAGGDGLGASVVGIRSLDRHIPCPLQRVEISNRPWGVGLEPAVEEVHGRLRAEYLRPYPALGQAPPFYPAPSPLRPYPALGHAPPFYPAPSPIFPAPSPPSVGLRFAAGSPGAEAAIRIEVDEENNAQVARVDNRFVHGLVHALLLGNAGKPQGVLLCAQGSAMEHVFIAGSMSCQVYLLYMLFEGTADSEGPHNDLLCAVCLIIFGAAVAEAFYPAYMHQKQVVTGMCSEWNKCQQCLSMWLIFADLCVFSATLIFGSNIIIASEDTKDMVIDTLAAMFIPDIDNLLGRVAYTMHRSGGGAVDVPAAAVIPLADGFDADDVRTPQEIAAFGMASRLIGLRGFAWCRSLGLMITDPSWRPLLRLGGIIACAFCLWAIDRPDVRWALPSLAGLCLAHLFFTVSRRASESFLASLLVMAFPAVTVLLQFCGSRYILTTSGSLPAAVTLVGLLQFVALCFLHLVSKAKDESSFWWLGSPMVALCFWFLGSMGAGACIVWLCFTWGIIPGF